MAEKKNGPAAVYLPDQLPQDPPQPSRKKRILKLLAILLLILILIIGGFFVGIYLRIFDTNEMNDRLGLYDLPVIGQFFVKPAPKNGSSDAAATDTSDPKSKPVEDVKPKVDDKAASKPVVLTKAEIEKQMKARQAEEKKRVSKLARLYNEMKPQEAADVMDALDDDMTIAILQRMDESQAAKILAKFDPDKSARLTKIMYSGVPAKVQNTANGAQSAAQGGNADTGGTDNTAAQTPNP